MEVMDYNNYINNVDDFPVKGIQYKDIQPLLAESSVFKNAILEMGQLINKVPTYWVGIESRGFLFASALSYQFGGGIRIVRKRGKLPNNKKFFVQYGLAYIPQHDLGTCVVVDDVLATGGTMEAASNLCEMVGLDVVDRLCLLDIGIYKGDESIKCLIK
jgi:adenine phosphoribosyltransferase